jgi:capsular exopolysaccharide synthesis family protein
LLCAAVAAAAGWFLLPPPVHTVRTKLQVPLQRNLFFKTNEPTPDLISHQRNQVALVKSRLVLSSAINDPRVGSRSIVPEGQEPIEWLEKKIQVDFSVAPEIMSISITGNNTADLVVLVDAIRDAFLREVVNKGRLTRQERLERLRKWRETLQKSLKANHDLQNNLGKKFGGKDALLRAKVLDLAQQRLARFEGELLKTQTDLERARLHLASLRDQEKSFDKLFKPTEAEVQSALESDREIEPLAATVKEKKRTYDKNKETLRSSSPILKGYRAQYEDAQARLAAARKRHRPRIIERLQKESRSALQTKIVLAEREIEGLQRSEGALDNQVNRLREYAADLSGEGIRLEVIQEDVSHLTESLKKIRLEEMALQFEMNASAESEQASPNVLEKAIVVRVDATKRRLMMSGGAGAGVLALVLLGIAWLEYRTRRLDSTDEVVHGLGLRLLGALPDSSPARHHLPWRGAGKQQATKDLLAESVDAARAILLYTARQESVRVVLVTSAVAGEGKTSLACHLATSVARAGLRTLLIDGDLRKPAAHLVFGVPPAPGFSDLLRKETTLASAIRPTGVTRLWILPAGDDDSATAQALAQGQAGELLGQLRQQFDFILIDSSPVLPVADALLLGQHADGALISVLRGTSRMPTVYAASQRLEALGIRTLGVIMSGVDLDGATYRYPAHPQQSTQARKTSTPV